MIINLLLMLVDLALIGNKRRAPKQHVTSSTHKRCHSLNVTISRETSSIEIGVASVCDPCLSNSKGESFGDYLAVQFIEHMIKLVCLIR